MPAPARPAGDRALSTAAAPHALPVVHAVTNDEIVADRAFVERARGVMRALGARGAVHLRAPSAGGHRLLALAAALAEAQAATGAWLVVNDRVDVALAAGARGVQLTSRSLPVADARRIAPALAAGASVHTVDEAVAAARAGAHWVVAGHVFATASHPGDAGRGPAFVRQLTERAGVPVVAIGGVVPGHVVALRRLGVHGVAAIRGIWSSHDAERAATDYLSSYDAYDGT